MVSSRRERGRDEVGLENDQALSTLFIPPRGPPEINEILSSLAFHFGLRLMQVTAIIIHNCSIR